MADSPEPDRANRRIGCYGKRQSILFEKMGEKPIFGKSKDIIAREGKAAKKLVKNLSKTEIRKKRGFTKGSATTTSREARSNSRSTHKKNVTKKIRPFFRN